MSESSSDFNWENCELVEINLEKVEELPDPHEFEKFFDKANINEILEMLSCDFQSFYYSDLEIKIIYNKKDFVVGFKFSFSDSISTLDMCFKVFGINEVLLDRKYLYGPKGEIDHNEQNRDIKKLFLENINILSNREKINEQFPKSDSRSH